MMMKMNKTCDSELSSIMSHPIKGVMVMPCEKDCSMWYVLMCGPTGSPYEGGKFRMTIKFPDNYPTSCPTFTFTTPIFHPNVSETGMVCSSCSGCKTWSPTSSISSCLTSIMTMLSTPVPGEPSNKKASEMFSHDMAKFTQMASMETHKSAMLS